MTGEPHSSTHPPLPPPTEENRFSWLRLLRSRRVSPATFWRLLSEHGSAAAALDALPDIARAAGIDGYVPCPDAVIHAELKAGRAMGARLLTGACPDYPLALRDLDDAPPALWALGDCSLLARPMVALVGARAISSLGVRMARKLSLGLSEAGLVVVSGMARGVDAEAHAAALAGGTIAVMAGGVDQIYPPENGNLIQRLRDHGLILSEQPPGAQALPRHLVARNRIISGLSRAVVVVEAAARSGSLITARNALDQGRDVMAVPGHPFEQRSAGSNMLLRDGAILVRGPEDVLEHLGIAPAARAKAAAQPADAPPAPGPADAAPPRPAANPPLADQIPPPPPPQRGLRETAALHSAILARIAQAPVIEDQLIRDLAVGSQAVGPALVVLELEGRIARRSGGVLTAI